MQYRLLGKTGVHVSSLALGTMTFGKEADEKTSLQMVDYALDQGVNLFDTADFYTGGLSEEILGKALRGKRQNNLVATKAFFPIGQGINQKGLSKRHLIHSVETSLRRLQTDYIDLFYLHCFDATTDLEESLRALELLVQQGKILYPAVSNFAGWQAMDALSIAQLRNLNPIVAIQPMYNLLKRQAEVEILPFAKAKEIAVIPYSPLGAGMLTGKYRNKPASKDARLNQSPQYQVRYGDTSYQTVVDRFIEHCDQHDFDPVAEAINWVRSHPNVTSVLLGARNMDQLKRGLSSANSDPSPEKREVISALSDAPPLATDRREEQLGLQIGKK